MRVSRGLFLGLGRAPRALTLSRPLSTSIKYTYTDEAPMLATYALLPVLRRFAGPAGIDFERVDISVAGRILSHFPEFLSPEQRVDDHLSALGELVKTPEANVIKLPNVSASLPQLLDAISELQKQGFKLPDYPANPKDDAERDIQQRYAKVLGSAVNPVLREGNSDRRVAPPVKAFAMKHPPPNKPWNKESKTRVAHMEANDFFGSEQSHTSPGRDDVKIEFISASGHTRVLKASTPLLPGEIIDAQRMSGKHVREFFEQEFTRAKEEDVMVSLHLKATMMKVSDPILFGHAVTVFFKDLFEKHGETFKKLGVNPNNGFADVESKIASLPDAERKEIEKDIEACYAARPRLAMVNSHKGITNLHVPSDVIIDASMPNVVRDSGGMWNKDDKLEDVVCIIPDRCYAGIYKEIIEYVQEHGQFDASKTGNVSNVGLMAQKAEEYGSHDKTFPIGEDGWVRVTNRDGEVVFEHSVKEGDIWRMCQTKDEPIKDWVKLAVSRARATGATAVFWLNQERPHDAEVLKKVQAYLALHETEGLDIQILAPAQAMRLACERATAGKDTITATGNVLRDYLTDLFPILELGTSAKMLSIVPMLTGGAMFETGAGGSAPKHVQQFVEEGHLRWDSLGEYLATAVSLEDLAAKTDNTRAKDLGETLMEATGRLLDENKSPSRKVNELDNRGSTFYIAKNWAAAMAKRDPSYKALAAELEKNEAAILKEMIDCQGKSVDIGGYYRPDHAKAEAAMRPSATFNKILDDI